MSSPSFQPAVRPVPPPPAPLGMAHVVNDGPVDYSPPRVVEVHAPAKKKSPRLNLDSVPVLVFTVVVVFAIMTASFMASFVAIIDVAAHTGIPKEFLWLFPTFIDLAILGYTLSLFNFKRRGEPTGKTLAGLLGFAALSIAANVVHTVDYWGGDVSSYQAWIGIILTASAPIAVLLASEEIGRLAFEPADNDE